jgi:carboxypeptidase family protein/TonB-dependent receptor-like protein
MENSKRTLILMAISLLIYFGVVSPVSAQTNRGAIRGTVSDPSGAVVAGASVTATNVATSVDSKATTDANGNFTIPFLPPGVYRVTVEQPGFKKAVFEKVNVSIGETIRQDAILAVGEVSQSVSVEAETIALKPETSELGTTISGQQILDLPLAGNQGEQRNPIAFMTLIPGVTGRGAIYTNERYFNQTINGGQSAANEFSVEGAPILNSNGSGDGRIIGFPQDAVQEFKLVSNNFSAEMGRAGGGFVNFNLRSGTNDIHGSAWEFLRNDALNANGFFTNQGAPDPATGKAKRSVLRQNEFGATAGGPLKKDKTFFFGWYSGFRFTRGAQNQVVTMPTEAFKHGDFSQVLREQGRQIYDPATTRTDANGNIVRDPFPGNIIPSSRFDPVAVNFLKYYVPPTDPSKFVNNYVASTQATRSTDQWGIKIDHKLSDNHKIFGSYLKSNYVTQGGSPYPGALDSAGIGGYPIQIFRFAYDTVLRPTLLNHAIFGFNRHNYRGESTTNGQGIPADFGLKGVPQDGCMPQFNLLGTTGGGCNSSQVNTNYYAQENLTWLKGKHTLKFGYEYRKQGFNIFSTGNATGAFFWEGKPTSLPSQPSTTGLGFADFMLGQVGRATLDVQTGPTYLRSWYNGGYVQDDIKVTSKLTLNLGLRYDLASPAVEKYNHMSWFDRNTPNPAAGGIPGALVFASPSRRVGLEMNKKEFGPRFGFAYSWNPKTVIRGGYGISYAQTNTTQALGQIWNGFSATARANPSTLTPNDAAFIMKDGFPTSLIPKLPSIDPSLLNGAVGYEMKPEWGRSPYVQSFNLNIQREVGRGFLFDIAWAGSKGTRLISRNQWADALDPKYLALGDLLALDARSPQAQAAGIRIPYASFQGTVAQALRPFPQYNDVSAWWQNTGSSTYHSMQVKLEKRFSQGLAFMVAYTWSKSLTDSDSQFSVFSGMAQTGYNQKAEKSYAINDIPAILTLNYSYDLPFGEGKKFLNKGGVSNKVFGGWKFTGIQTYQSGAPAQIMQNVTNSSLFIGGFGDPSPSVAFLSRPNVVPGASRRSARYHASDFDPAKDKQYNIDAFSVATSYATRNAPRMFGDIRFFPYLNEDFGIIKRTQITEKVSVDFRAEFFNAFNRTVFGYIQGEVFAGAFENNIQDPTNFGKITGVNNNPRQVQFGLKINY